MSITPKLTILIDGKVGIGNTAPLEKLDVSGNIYCRNTMYIGVPDAITTPAQISGYALAVNGIAIFNRAKVKLYGNWPDYVFDHKYLPGAGMRCGFVGWVSSAGRY